MATVRVLLLADTHLGFDLPARPRVDRRLRGPDFFANFERALEPALCGDVDLVVHGGDVLYRSKVRRELVYRAFEPLARIAAGGVPVVVVPGNHERSAIPFPLLTAHAGLYVLQRPETVALEVRGEKVAISGFPFVRHNLRRRFSGLVAETGWAEHAASIRVLCIHQTVEGARVGPSGYEFGRQFDVVRGRDIPSGFAAVLAGHIHRHQVLTSDLSARRLAAPVLYPGSIERTSTAERNETKGFVTLELSPGDDGGCLDRWKFHPLPARPMVDLEIVISELDRRQLTARLRESLASVDTDAVVRLRLIGSPKPDAAPVIRASSLRSLAPPTLSLSVSRPGGAGVRGRRPA